MTTDQPTTTSSLEEARQSLVRCEACKGRGGFSDTSMGRGGFAGQMLTGCSACSGSGIDTRELEAFIKAAARAEVIREVEALMREEGVYPLPHYGEPEGLTNCAANPFTTPLTDDELAATNANQFHVKPCDCGADETNARIAARLRALSQGGEGKSDG